MTLFEYIEYLIEIAPRVLAITTVITVVIVGIACWLIDRGNEVNLE
jgi:hypothetical protein